MLDSSDLPEEVDCNRDSAAARQHNIDEGRPLTKHHGAIASLFQRQQRLCRHGGFHASAGNIAAVATVSTNHDVRAKRARRAAANFYQRCDGDTALSEGFHREP